MKNNDTAIVSDHSTARKSKGTPLAGTEPFVFARSLATDDATIYAIAAIREPLDDFERGLLSEFESRLAAHRNTGN